MDFAALASEYGYAATFGGVLLEGESILVLAGATASRGYLDIRVLIAIGAIGAFLTDNFFFAVGRHLGPTLTARFPALMPSAAKARDIVSRYPRMAVVGMRFLYGMRIVGPATIGASGMAWSRYLTLDAIAATAWSCCWTLAGHVLGEAAGRLSPDAVVIGGMILLAVVIVLVIAARSARCRLPYASAVPREGHRSARQTKKEAGAPIGGTPANALSQEESAKTTLR
jgi:membrane protein DedA with SNARE-associated domain